MAKRNFTGFIGKSLAAAVIAALALSLTPAAARSAPNVGTVRATLFSAYGTPPDGSRELKFLDETFLVLGSESELVIDTFVYDPKGGDGYTGQGFVDRGDSSSGGSGSY